MSEFRIKMVAKTIWLTNFLEDTLPKEITQKVAEDALTKAYEDDHEMVIFRVVDTVQR